MALRLKLRLLRAFIVTSSGFLVYIVADRFYDPLLKPTLQLLDPERAHDLAIWAAKHGLVPQDKNTDWSGLACQVWGRTFSNPVGLAAGFDKHGECVDSLLSTGFGFVEVGSVTPEPQEGHPRPRIFRLVKDKAVINRCGFNSVGSAVVSERLRRRLDKTHLKKAQPGIVGVNLGKNKESQDATNDYEKGVLAFADIGDYLVINVSSPNTPNLRNLQGKDVLHDYLLIDTVLKERTPAGRPPILVKISPDLNEKELKDIVDVCMDVKVDGIIISNTTIQRPSNLLEQQVAKEKGGLSGPPLKDISTALIKKVYQMTNGRKPKNSFKIRMERYDSCSSSLVIVGVGGISNAEDAYEKIRAGASLVQLYTALVILYLYHDTDALLSMIKAYEGPSLVRKIKSGLTELLQQDGFDCITEAVRTVFMVGKDISKERNAM
eukprot:jgi/Galph1/5668/GphlegSOOS_G4402.1